ncbi:MAG: VCBS repeat-containing protein [Myxococcales bacterium]|nr:VCBS repeat-containing protein [Myxococcales bacterium]
MLRCGPARSYRPIALPLLAFAVGCNIDNGLSGKTANPPIFDTGTEYIPVTDSEDSSPPDSPVDSVPLESCGDQYFPAKNLPQLEECFSEGSTVGTFTPEVLWSTETFATNSGSVSCMMQPIVCSLTDDNGDGTIDDDDTPDVMIITYSPGVLRAMNGDDGTELWSATGGGQIQITGGAACGDIDNDGVVEVIAATSSGVDVFDNTGNLKWSFTGGSGHLDGTSDAPGIADMDHDGNPEVLIGNCILDNSGSKLGCGTGGYGTSSNVGSAAFAVDLDQDGELELVAANAVYDINGTSLWSNGQQDGYVAVGNFDGDDYGEIAVTGDAKMRVQDDDGTVLCSAAIPAASSSYGGPPTVADFDGDGEAEIGVAANSTYTVFETDCSVLWQYTGTTDPSSGNTGSAVFDFEGDGIADVVYADERWVWVFNGADGSVKMQDTNHSNNTWLEYPTVADINADGSADIAVCNTPGSWGSHNGVTVFSDADLSWRKGRPIWNQHGYSITNVNDDGSIPRDQDTNWLTYNNFRSGDLTPGVGYSGPDLIATIEDVCVDECVSDNIVVWVTVGNQGYTDVTDPFNIEIIGETDVGEVILSTVAYTAGVVQGYQTDSISVELVGVPKPLYDVRAEVDGGNSESLSEIDECYELNNEDTWGAIVCL